jgi:RimJ/RimL family protein N-acetyltransferase
MPPSILDLRPVTIEDAPLVADLETAISPDDPRDPVMMAFWWNDRSHVEKAARWINVSDGVAQMFVFAGHSALDADPRRFGQTRVRVHPSRWADELFSDGVATAEAWLRDEGARTAVAKVREDAAGELRVLKALGYVEERRYRNWALDLVKQRDLLLAAAERTSLEMRAEGILITTLDRDDDPDRLMKLYRLDIEATEDIPKTAPWPMPPFEEWRKSWFENPAHAPDRFWIARAGDEIVGLSVIGYPPVRGIPFTSFTCTSRSARGRGVARALKHASVKQALERGAKSVETQNDADNAPILRLNQEMGYRPAKSVIELHRTL